jgi:two-component system, chemotaxis family, protein-glutamate methylesterase/glutaminase
MATAMRAVVMGGSAGALEALTSILQVLPPTFSAPLVVVLHMLASKPSGLAQALRPYSSLTVKEAEDKEMLAGGTVYLASPNYHLLIEKRGCFSLSADDPVGFSRPSIDVLFDSAAVAFGPALVGVLLSGANDDGSLGLKHVREAGGITIVQSPSTAPSPQMPQAALHWVDRDHVIAPAQIGHLLTRLDMPHSAEPIR